MLYKIARKIKTEYLDSLSFADRTGGLVRTMNDHRKGEKKYPIEINQDKELGDNQYLRHLVPDSNLKSVMYFEMNNPPSLAESHNSWDLYEAGLSLVCWFNYQKVDPEMYDPSYLISEINAAIPFKIGKIGCINTVTCDFAGQDHNDGAIFDKYTYTESESQFFKYPYEYFVLNFDISYRIAKDCSEEDISDITIDPVLLYISRDDDMELTIGGVSGKEYQLHIYASDNTDITAKSVHEYSGEDNIISVTPIAGKDTILKIDYGQEYLRKIDVSDKYIIGLTIPNKPLTMEECLQISYIDLSDNDIIDESYFTALIDYLYFSEINNGTLLLDGGSNAAITDVVSLAYLVVLASRGWTITNN